jgi:TRAP-type C4-dicarboxylate transport system permease small subunit
MKAIDNFFWNLNRALMGICGVFIALAATLASINAILRFTRGAGFSFSDEICVYTIALLVFIAFGYLDLTDGHLTIDVVSVIVKNATAKKIMLYLRGCFTLIFEGMLVYYGIRVTKIAYARLTVTNVMHVPRFYIYGIVTAALAISFLSWLVILLCRKGEFEK